MQTLQIIGADILDTCFAIEFGGESVTWNVTRLQCAAHAGKLGPIRRAPMSRIPPADWTTGNLDREAVDRIKQDPKRLDEPAIAIEAPESGMLRCFVDGSHRVTARQELGLDDVAFYVVPLAVERDYRVVIQFT